MNSKKMGWLLLVVSIALLVIFITAFNRLSVKSDLLGCFSAKECDPVQATLSWVHAGFGLFGFLFALGFYLIFFSQGEQAVIQHLHKEQEKMSREEKFTLLLRGLDEFEQQVLTEVRRQEGITQNTLRLRVNMSKAKLSQVLTNLEKKKLVKREAQKKKLAVHSTLPF